MNNVMHGIGLYLLLCAFHSVGLHCIVFVHVWQKIRSGENHVAKDITKLAVQHDLSHLESRRMPTASETPLLMQLAQPGGSSVLWTVHGTSLAAPWILTDLGCQEGRAWRDHCNRSEGEKHSLEKLDLKP